MPYQQNSGDPPPTLGAQGRGSRRFSGIGWLAQHPHDRLFGAQTERERNGTYESTGETVGIAIEGTRLQSLEGTPRNLGQISEFIDRNPAQAPLAREIDTDRGVSGSGLSGQRRSFRVSSDLTLHRPPGASATAAIRCPMARLRLPNSM